MTRFPFSDLEQQTRSTSSDELATALGVSKQTIIRYRNRGLSHKQADHVATRVGYHPMSIWPDWIDTEDTP